MIVMAIIHLHLANFEFLSGIHDDRTSHDEARATNVIANPAER